MSSQGASRVARSANDAAFQGDGQWKDRQNTRLPCCNSPRHYSWSIVRHPRRTSRFGWTSFRPRPSGSAHAVDQPVDPRRGRAAARETGTDCPAHVVLQVVTHAEHPFRRQAEVGAGRLKKQRMRFPKTDFRRDDQRVVPGPELGKPCTTSLSRRSKFEPTQTEIPISAIASRPATHPDSIATTRGGRSGPTAHRRRGRDRESRAGRPRRSSASAGAPSPRPSTAHPAPHGPRRSGN